MTVFLGCKIGAAKKWSKIYGCKTSVLLSEVIWKFAEAFQWADAEPVCTCWLPELMAACIWYTASQNAWW